MKVLHPKYVNQKYFLLDMSTSLPRVRCRSEWYRRILKKHPLIR
jgi:hypothetical protein